MRKMKPLGKRSFVKSALRALGMDRSSVSPSLSQAESKPPIPGNLTSHGFTRTALQEAEQAKAKAIMELRRRQFL